MAENITRIIHFKSQRNGETNPADMRVTTFSLREQKMRAIKSMLFYWLIAAFTALIPIAHLLLVPGFFIGGIIVLSRRWKTAEEGHDATGACPACGKQICIPLEKIAELPQWHNCPECSNPLVLEQAEPEEDSQP